MNDQQREEAITVEIRLLADLQERLENPRRRQQGDFIAEQYPEAAAQLRYARIELETTVAYFIEHPWWRHREE